MSKICELNKNMDWVIAEKKTLLFLSLLTGRTSPQLFLRKAGKK